MKKSAPKSHVIGYWVNSTTPDLSNELRAHVGEGTFDPEIFTAWLGEKLAAYRGDDMVRTLISTPAEELAYLVGLQRKLTSAYDEANRMQSVYEPARAGARLSSAARVFDLNWSEMREALPLTLLKMLTVVERALGESRANTSVQAGRPLSANGRDRLVADVVAKLKKMAPKVKAEARLQTAREVLTKCGVHGLGDVKRSVRRGQK